MSKTDRDETKRNDSANWSNQAEKPHIVGAETAVANLTICWPASFAWPQEAAAQNTRRKGLFSSVLASSFARIPGGPRFLRAKLFCFARPIVRLCLSTRVWCPAVRAELVLVLRTAWAKVSCKIQVVKDRCQ